MRLLLDLQALQGPSAERGIGYYARSLTRALADSRGEHEVVALLDGARPAADVLRIRHELSPALRRDDVVLFEAPELAARAAGRPEAELAREAAVATLRPDVVLLTSVFELPEHAPLSVNRWCTDIPTAAVLYDLIPLTDLDEHKADPAARRTYLHGVQQLARADLLLSISDHSAAEAQRLVPACPPVRTIGGAAPAPKAPRRPSWAPPAGFALAVGRDEPRKDIATAVLAWAALPDAVRAGRPFVVVGEWPQDNQRRLRARVRLPPDQLLFPGQVDDHEVAWAYRSADVLLFPSLAEGLGLPPLEAMEVGTPVLLAATSSLLELVDDDEAYFPAGDVPALTARLQDLLTDPAVRSRLVDAGHAATGRFTWEQTAARAWAALEGLSGAGQPATPHDPVLHALAPPQEWARVSELLADQPGVVVVDEVPPPNSETALLLAPAVGVLVPDVATCTALLRQGVVDVPLHIADPSDPHAVAAAVTDAYATDLGGIWAAGAARAGGQVTGDAVERRPRWAARGTRGRLLATDVTVYRSTPFMSGIQRTAARLHHALTDVLRLEGGALLPLQLGISPDGTAHPDIRSDEVLGAADAEARYADWLLCLDLNSQVAGSTDVLDDARARGTGVVVNVFDLIPYTHPEWFPAGAAATSFTPWLHAVASVADVLLVNSRATAEDLESFVRRFPPRRPDAFRVHHLPLGADFDEATDVQVSQREAGHFLVVGTVEPRKGHAGVLDAFERLWASGQDVRLTVVGRSGWLVDDLVRRMEALQAEQPGFSWLQNASDAELDRLYRTCTAAVVASAAEGFGLPVVEAALRDCPVIVHDIPVLRELAGDAATYFSAHHPLDQVLSSAVRGEPVRLVPRSGLLSWSQVGDRLLQVLDGQAQPLASWSPEDGWLWR